MSNNDNRKAIAESKKTITWLLQQPGTTPETLDLVLTKLREIEEHLRGLGR